MNIPDELKGLLEKQIGKMEKKMIEAFVQKQSIEAIVEVAKDTIKEENSTET